MKKIIIAFILLLSSSIGFAQKDSIRLKELNAWIKEQIKIVTDRRAVLGNFVDKEKEYTNGKYTDEVSQLFYNMFARLCNQYGLYDVALAILIDLEQNSKTTFKSYLATAASTFSEIKDGAKTIEYCKKYFSMPTAKIDSQEISGVYSILIDHYIQQNQPKAALIELSHQFPFITDSDQSSLSTYFHNYGVARGMTGSFDDAKLYLHKSFIMDLQDTARISYNLPYYYLDMGNVELRQGNYKKALLLYDSAQFLLDDQSTEELTLKVYDAICVVSEKLNHFEKGFKFSQKYRALHDTIFSLQRQQNIGRIELQSYLTQKQREEDQRRRQAEEEFKRKRTIQYNAVNIFILTITIGVLYGGKLKVNPKILKNITFFTILVLFEFVLILLEPTLNKFTGNSPIFILLGNIVVAILFVPLNRAVENWFGKAINLPNTNSKH